MTSANQTPDLEQKVRDLVGLLDGSKGDSQFQTVHRLASITGDYGVDRRRDAGDRTGRGASSRSRTRSKSPGAGDANVVCGRDATGSRSSAGDVARGRSQTSSTLSHPHRSELMKLPTVQVHGPDLQKRFWASHRRVVSAVSERASASTVQLSTVVDSVVIGPRRVSRQLAEADATRLRDAKDNVLQLFGVLCDLHRGRPSVCHEGKASCIRGWELQVESNFGGVGGKQRFRSICHCDTEENDRLQLQQLNISSPWRSSRGQAENDLELVRLTFAAKGIVGAMCCAADLGQAAAATAASAQSKAAGGCPEVKDRPPGYFGHRSTANRPVARRLDRHMCPSPPPGRLDACGLGKKSPHSGFGGTLGRPPGDLGLHSPCSPAVQIVSSRVSSRSRSPRDDPGSPQEYAGQLQ